MRKCKVCGNTEHVYDGISDGGLRFVRYPEPICNICSTKLGIIDQIRIQMSSEIPIQSREIGRGDEFVS
jgi:hypothetical protein